MSKCSSSPDRHHYRDNQGGCHYCGIPMLEGYTDAPDTQAKAPSRDSTPLPIFRVVQTALPKQRFAQLDEKASPNLIELCQPRLRSVAADERRYVIFHELGHWFRHAFVPRKIAGEEETFAHDFGIFFTAPQALFALKPGRFALLTMLVDRHESRIRQHALKMLRAIK